MEYVPQNLYQWLNSKLKEGGRAAAAAVTFVDDNLKSTTSFMNERGFMHFDAHFENILTDGELLYFSDFGLAIFSNFELTNAEREFLKRHHNYDRCCAAVNLLHCIIASIFGKDQWGIKLQKYLDDDQYQMTPAIAEVIKKYSPIALTMDEFFQDLQKKTKQTHYQVSHFESLLAAIE